MTGPFSKAAINISSDTSSKLWPSRGSESCSLDSIGGVVEERLRNSVSRSQVQIVNVDRKRRLFIRFSRGGGVVVVVEIEGRQRDSVKRSSFGICEDLEPGMRRAHFALC
jgi:hypothetical protein